MLYWSEVGRLLWQFWFIDRKLIHHRKETVSRKAHLPSTQGMTASSSDHHLDLARQPNGVCRTGYERHHSLPNTEPQEDEGSLYQVVFLAYSNLYFSRYHASHAEILTFRVIVYIFLYSAFVNGYRCWFYIMDYTEQSTKLFISSTCHRSFKLSNPIYSLVLVGTDLVLFRW